METIKHRLSNRLIFASAFVVAAFLLLASVSKAEAASIYLSPATGSVQTGGNLAFEVRLDPSPGGTRNVVFSLAFDTNLVDEAASTYSLSGSAFSQSFFPPEFAISTGTLVSVQYLPLLPSGPATPVTTDVLIGKVNLKTTGSGSLAVNFVTTGDYATAVGDAASTTGGSLPLTMVNGSYTITSIPTPPPPSGSIPPPSSSTPPSSSGTKPPSSSTPPSSGGTSTPPPVTETTNVTDTTMPQISNLKVTVTSDTEATVEWTTDEEAVSYVQYGFTEDYAKSEASMKYTKSHSITLKNLEPSTKYNFRVMSSDHFNNVAYSNNETFTTKPPIEVQQTYRMIGLAMIIGGLLALAIIAFFYFRKKGPHPDNLAPQTPQTPDGVNLNPPI